MLFVKELPSLKIHFTKLVDNYPNEPKNNIFISKGSFNFVKTLPNGPLIHKEYKGNSLYHCESTSLWNVNHLLHLFCCVKNQQPH